MISLKQSLDDFEQVRSLLDAYAAALLATVEAIGKHALEVDAATVHQLRTNLTGISEHLQSGPGEISACTAEIDAALDDYHGGGTAYIEKIRSDLAETSTSLTALLETFQTDNNMSVERRLSSEVMRLRSLEKVVNLEVIREGLKRSTHQLEDCAEQVRREKDSVIAQLRSEIQTLQTSLEHAHRAQTLDILTTILKKEEFIRLLRRELARDADIGVVHIRLRNLNQLMATYPPAVIEELVSTFSKRMENVVPPESICGRWAPDVFCVAVPDLVLRSISAALAKSCIGRYVCTQDGVARNIEVSGTLTTLGPQSNEKADIFLAKIDQIHPR